MEEAKKASFQFDSFQINRSLIEVSDPESSELSIAFNPAGKLDYENGEFYLFLDIRVQSANKEILVELNSTARFKFENILRERLPSFLYNNAPAILFPYLRAHITTLTSLSGMQPIILPTMNLQSLRSELESNIEE